MGTLSRNACETIAVTRLAAQPEFENALVLYEYPFNEGIRTMLRLEHLFDRMAGSAKLGGGATLHGCRIAPAPVRHQVFGPKTLVIARESSRRAAKTP